MKSCGFNEGNPFKRILSSALIVQVTLAVAIIAVADTRPEQNLDMAIVNCCAIVV